MATSGKPRSTRDRPAKPPLSAEAIVAAAVGIVQAEGLEAMSLRRVAAALDTSAGSLYVYLPGREGLLAAVFDHVLAGILVDPPEPGRWREQLHVLAVRTRDAFVGHPGLAAATLADPPRTVATMRLLENLLGLLTAAGLDARDAAWTADTIFAQVTHAAIEAEQRPASAEELAAGFAATVAALPAGEFPFITAHADALVSGDVAERFRYAIDIVVDGALARR